MSIQPQDDPSVRCAFCLRSVPLSLAADTGWTPSFLLTEDDETGESVCPSCSVAHLDFPADDLDVPMVKPGHGIYLNRGKGPTP